MSERRLTMSECSVRAVALRSKERRHRKEMGTIMRRLGEGLKDGEEIKDIDETGGER